MREYSKLKIGIIGILPPPYGGISIHVKRLQEYLLSKQINVAIIDEYKSLNRIKLKIRKQGGLRRYYHSLQLKNHIYHYHSPNRIIRLLLGIIASVFGIKVIITLHGEGIKDQIDGHGVFWKYIYTYALSQLNFIICDNDDLQNYICKNGVSLKKTKVIPAFIPPIINKKDLKEIPKYILDFYNKYEITIFSMGWIKFHKGVDLYGLDMILDLVEILNEKYHTKVGFAIKLLISDIQDYKYYDLWIKRANSFQNVLVILEDLKEIYPLEKNATIVIRPSCTDGDSISIRESLYFGTHVVTSDAIPRPEGCILFRNRDINDFEIKTTEIIDKIIRKEKVPVPEQINNAVKILELYHSLV